MLGVTVEGAPPARKESDVVEIEVEPENWKAACVFNAMDTQWRFTTLNTANACAVIRTGLDYGALATVALGHGAVVDADLLAAIRVLEQETVRIHGERARRQLKPS